MNNDINDRLKELKIEDIVWIIYIGIIGLSLYSNNVERHYFIYKDIFSKELYQYVLLNILMNNYIYYLKDYLGYVIDSYRYYYNECSWFHNQCMALMNLENSLGILDYTYLSPIILYRYFFYLY